MYEISIVDFAGKEVFSHMTFCSTDCLANTSRKLGTYLLTYYYHHWVSLKLPQESAAGSRAK